MLWKSYQDANPSLNWILDGGVLHFKRVSRGDMGAYLCMAANGIPPIVSRRIHLDVLCKPINEYDFILKQVVLINDFSYFKIHPLFT